MTISARPVFVAAFGRWSQPTAEAGAPISPSGGRYSGEQGHEPNRARASHKEPRVPSIASRLMAQGTASRGDLTKVRHRCSLVMGGVRRNRRRVASGDKTLETSWQVNCDAFLVHPNPSWTKRAICVLALALAAVTAAAADQKPGRGQPGNDAKHAKVADHHLSNAEAIHFSTGEAGAIREADRQAVQGAAAGLQKEVARGGQLPPGWQKQF